MQAFPHHYRVDASVRPEGDALLTSDGVEAIASAPPKEFGGPGNRWSPEALRFTRFDTDVELSAG